MYREISRGNQKCACHREVTVVESCPFTEAPLYILIQ